MSPSAVTTEGEPVQRRPETWQVAVRPEVTPPPAGTTRRAESGCRRWGRRLMTASALFLIILYLLATPDGLLGKADLVAYAVCHRIPSHSFAVDQRLFPLCARCTGTYLGAMVAIIYFLLFRRRAGELPPVPLLLTLVGFTALMALDGANSYLTLMHSRFLLYQPHNALRLLTGTLNGVTLGTVLYPVTVATVWRSYRCEPILRTFKELGLVVLAALGVSALALTGWSAILFALAALSAAGVAVLLGLVNTVMVLTLSGRENQAGRWQDLVLPLLIGLALALTMVGVVDAVRYGLTGTLVGLPGLPK